MRTLLFILLAGALPAIVHAQNNNNNLSVNLENSLQFVLNDSWDIEQAKTVTNALKLTVKTQSKNCYIYGKLHSITGNTSTPLSPGYFKIKYRSTTAGSGQVQSLNTQDITLSYSNQLLFQQKKTSSTRHYYYDFKLEPMEYDFNPGNYGFTMLFTMTQP